MRSVLVFLRNTTESEVEAYLDAEYPSQRDPWVVRVGGDPCLYIHFCRDGPREHEPDEWADILQRFGGEPAVAVIAFVSGRHPGDEQVAAFVGGFLSRFSGAAMDEDTLHLWSLAEVQNGHLVEGHPFFDYNGWFAEDERRRQAGGRTD
jgi:hypothetical protein